MPTEKRCADVLSELKWSDPEPGDGAALSQANAVAGQTGEAGKGFLDAVFEWLGDLFASLFGDEDGEDESVDVATDELPYDPPIMDADIVLNEVLPPVGFEEELGLESLDDDDLGELALL